MNILYQTSDRNTFGVPDGQLMTFDASLQFITDRTQQDVSYVQQLAGKLIAGTATDFEKAEWNSTLLKGAYNYTDLNRVTAIMEVLKAKLESYGYLVPGYEKVKITHSTFGGGSNLPDGTLVVGDAVSAPVDDVVEYDPYTWYEFDYPTPDAMTVYLSNVAAIRSVIAVMKSTPSVPLDVSNFMTQEANDIEKILRDINLLVINSSMSWYYSRDLFSGEV